MFIKSVADALGAGKVADTECFEVFLSDFTVAVNIESFKEGVNILLLWIVV